MKIDGTIDLESGQTFVWLLLCDRTTQVFSYVLGEGGATGCGQWPTHDPEIAFLCASKRDGLKRKEPDHA